MGLDAGKQLSFGLSNFESKTPPGDAVITVLLEAHNGGWSQLSNVTLTLTKKAEKLTDPTIHYFTVDPDYILHAGDTQIAVGFYATAFKSLVLCRNNQEVQTWPNNQTPEKDGGVAGVFLDKPSITTVYRLEGQPKDTGQDEQIRYLNVQVISPGWNQIALPQGYPTRLFVNADFTPLGATASDRLYGIFVDSEGNAALYSSATGVDDWRLEPGDVPDDMVTSPGVAYQNKLWLIGGSCYDSDSPGSSVWCYEIDKDTGGRRWNEMSDFPEDMGSRAGHACVVVPRKNQDGTVVNEIWVIGGFNNGQFFGDTWRFDGNNWSQIFATGSTWSPRYMHAALSFIPATDQPTEVWIYGGAGDAGTLADLWTTKDGGLTWKQGDGILPPPGGPLGTALVSFDATRSGASQRLFLGGTFLEPAAGKRNRTSSYIFEWQWRNQRWEARPVVDGWERFEGSTFYMQAIAFNSFLFVWSLHTAIESSRLPKLNILIS
jgi:hypothetical protein